MSEMTKRIVGKSDPEFYHVKGKSDNTLCVIATKYGEILGKATVSPEDMKRDGYANRGQGEKIANLKAAIEYYRRKKNAMLYKKEAISAAIFNMPKPETAYELKFSNHLEILSDNYQHEWQKAKHEYEYTQKLLEQVICEYEDKYEGVIR